MNYKVKNLRIGVVDYVLLLAIFFPWVSFSTNNLDTQPWILVLFPAYLFLYFVFKKELKFRRDILYFSVLILFSVFVAVFFNFNGGDINYYNLLRSLASYTIFIFSILFFYFFALKNADRLYSILYLFNFIWLLIGFIQFIFGKYIFSFLVVVRTSEERGVTSLAPEPTFFALVLLFFNLMYLVGKKYNMNKMDSVVFYTNIIFIFFIAKSSLGIVLVPLLFILMVFKKITFSLLFKVGILLAVTLVVMFQFMEGSRVHTILSIIMSEGFIKLILLDASVLSRFLSIVYPFFVSIENLFLPGGFNGFNSFGSMSFLIGGDLVTYQSSEKIMSYIGSIFFELGFLSISIFFFIFYLIYDKTLFSIFEFAVLNVILLNALTVAFTFVPVLLVIFFLRKKSLI